VQKFDDADGVLLYVERIGLSLIEAVASVLHGEYGVLSLFAYEIDKLVSRAKVLSIGMIEDDNFVFLIFNKKARDILFAINFLI
jgi:hypothetical protein